MPTQKLKKIMMRVDRKHIAESKVRDSQSCMSANALRDHGYLYPVVDISKMRFSDPGTHLRYTVLTPPTVQRAILRWDRGEEIEPFAVVLHPVSAKPMAAYHGYPHVVKRAHKKWDKTKTRNAGTGTSRTRKFGLRTMVE